MLTRAGGVRFGLTKRTAELLAAAPAGGIFAILVHGKTGLTNDVAGKKRPGILRAAHVERNDAITVIHSSYGIVDCLDVVALIPDEGAFTKRQKRVREGKDVKGDSAVGYIGGGRHLIKGQAGDTVHQHMALVAPVEGVVLFGMLVGGGMYAQTAIGVGLRLMLSGELICLKGLGIVLGSIRSDRRRIKANERCVQNTPFIQRLYLRLHDLLQNRIIHVAQKAVKRPIGGQRFHDVEAAVVCNDEIVVQEVHKVCDLRKTFALHDDERAKHSRFRESSSPGMRSSLFHDGNVQMCKQSVVEFRFGRGGKETDILQYFLTMDNGHPLSG